ncbi:insulin-like peptide 7 [Brevipalpus obovatus]|uniref:insulin-like peptide 7 n=1 Tax=Brevipalpus obovatus TaxID=246614 RepID=UPI003D9E53EC
MTLNCGWLSLMALQVFFCYMSPLPTTISLSTPTTDLTAWENIFNTRSDDDWRAVWHSERHRRCYQELENHMIWVCRKDIYKVKKSEKENIRPVRSSDNQLENAFVSREDAYNILGQSLGSRRKKRGIIDECCHGTNGCSWEEYAEYCTHNNRMRT